MKKSKLQRKFLNQMRGMSDVPWPARRFTYPPTFAVGALPTTHPGTGALPTTLLGTCKRPVGSVRVRRGRLRRKQDVEVRCGGNVFLRRGSLGKRRLYCADCLERKRAKARDRRIELRLHSRFGIERAPEERTSKFKRFLRKGR